MKDTWKSRKCKNTLKYLRSEGIHQTVSSTFNMPQLSTVTRILRTEIHLSTYKIIICKELSPAEYGRHVDSSSNAYHWSFSNCLAENFRVLHARPLQIQKVTLIIIIYYLWIKQMNLTKISYHKKIILHQKA